VPANAGRAGAVFRKTNALSAPSKREITMKTTLGSVLIALVAAATGSSAQTGPAHTAVPAVHSVRATTAIVVDGLLNDEVWLRAPAVTAFTQRDPEEGKPVSETTELRIAYDEAALYVAARMHDRESSRIARQLARRDQDAEADAFTVFLDPHHDHVTGAAFRVSAAGVQSDATIYNDSWTDNSWDAVWESTVKIDETGWSAEMRIPYSQLRFSRSAQLTFGVNAMRYIQRKKEEAWLVHVPKTESGLASRMGHLDGLDGVAPHRTVELMPYVVSRAEYVEPEDGDPFNDGARAFAGTGADLKYRVSSSLSLDGTINPDFGQVEVDPAVVNLTAFETFFEEKRPFFIEGANIFSNFGRGGANNFWGFNRAEPQLFYSRRIGRAPQGSAAGDFVEQPSSTTILGAAKLTGKTRKGWSLGMLDAVTGREWAEAVSGLETTETEVEPLSNYLVGRAERELGRRAAIGALATAVNRDLRAQDLRAELPSQAYVGGVDGYLFLDSKREWVVNGRIAASHLTGSPEAMTRLQNASQRYFGRPDATHVELDPQATSLDGWTGSMNLNRNAGVHTVNAALWSVSPGFDSSDTGFTFAGDRAGVHAVYQWRNPKVTRFTRNRFLAIAKWYTWNFAPELQGDGIHMFGNVELKNYWTVFANVGLFRTVQDDRATRGGPSMLQPSSHNESIGIESDGRKRISVGGSISANHNDVGGRSRGLGINVRYRPAAALEISAGPNFERTHSLSQYVDAFEDPVAADTYGSRYVFSTLDQEEFSLQTRVNYVLSPKMSLQLYMQPLVSVGQYTGFKQFARPRTFDFIPLDAEPGSLTYDPINRTYTAKPADGGATFEFDDPDFNVKSLRLNLIYRWEWRPGSALYVVWTEQRQDDAYPGQFQLKRDLGSTFSAPADDVLMFKLAYWFQR
jgi:Domain of unknown function (DUF5916)/Carbohydrate family 9 binding domain-like